MNREHRQRKIITGALAATALLAAAACGQADGTGTTQAASSPTQSPTAPPPAESTPASPSPTGTAPAGAEDLKRAAQAALDAVPGSTLVTIESEEDGRLWEIQVVDQDGTEHELDVEASSGRVVDGPTAEDDDADDKAEHRELVQAAEVDYAEAVDKVVAAVPEGRVTELDLDSDDGKPVWEADVATSDGGKREVKVDAVSGEVTND